MLDVFGVCGWQSLSSLFPSQDVGECDRDLFLGDLEHLGATCGGLEVREDQMFCFLPQKGGDMEGSSASTQGGKPSLKEDDKLSLAMQC